MPPTHPLIRLALWLALLTGAGGCRSDGPGGEPHALLPERPAADTLAATLPARWPSTFLIADPSGLFNRVRFDTLLGPCGGQGGAAACTRVDFRYPYFLATVRGPLRQVLNQQVRTFLYGESPTPWKGYVPDPNPRFANDASYQWRLRRAVTLVRFDSIVSLELEGYEYTGGAHGLAVRRYLNLDAATGNAITLHALLSGEAQSRLLRLAEERLRRQYGVAADASLQEAGFWFEEDRFVLPRNFLPGRDSLYFQYQPYEVGPYARGMPRLAFGRQEVLRLLGEGATLGF